MGGMRVALGTPPSSSVRDNTFGTVRDPPSLRSPRSAGNASPRLKAKNSVDADRAAEVYGRNARSIGDPRAGRMGKVGVGAGVGAEEGDAPPVSAVLPDWIPVVDRRTGKTYYYNKKTRKTQWVPPTAED